MEQFDGYVKVIDRERENNKINYIQLKILCIFFSRLDSRFAFAPSTLFSNQKPIPILKFDFFISLYDLFLYLLFLSMPNPLPQFISLFFSLSIPLHIIRWQLIFPFRSFPVCRLRLMRRRRASSTSAFCCTRAVSTPP